MALNGCLARLSREILPSVLFPQPPLVRFAPETDTCCCGEHLLVQKTRRKQVFTMIGPFIARETLAQCPGCSRTFHSDPLLRMVASRCPACSGIAYDVLVFVGQALFRRHRNSEEVRAELIARNVRLSTSEIDYLGRKFVTLLALAHQRATPRIRQVMEISGGYVLHLDAMHEGEAPALMTGMDSLSEIVLANVKLPSEHADHIVPFLRKLKTDYGTPRACVHDMGSGILKAIAEVFPDTRDFICHFHFLRDIGKDLLEPAYAELRKRLRSHATSTRLHALARETRQCLVKQSSQCAMLAKTIKGADPAEDTDLMPAAATYSLTLWALHGKHSGDGYGFPFDRPLLEFAQRLLTLYRRLPELLDLLLTDEEPHENQAIFKLACEVSYVGNDPALCQAVEELRWRSLVFERLRRAMRIAPVHGTNGLNDEGTGEAMTTIRRGIEKFRQALDKDPKLAVDPLCIKMAEQIDKYWDKLFADPITVDTPNGPITIYPQRTNNILERFFRDERHAHRRKTGNDSMRRVLQAMLADTPLVKNLDNPDYMKILLDGKANLEELFAELGAAHLGGADGLQADTDRILPGFRALMKLPTLPEQVVRSLRKPVKMAKSN
jgi:hypothetical protein